MPDTPCSDQVEALSTPVARVTLARLHGELCISDGCKETGQLEWSGWAFTTAADGTRMGWAVRSCPQHLRGDDDDVTE